MPQPSLSSICFLIFSLAVALILLWIDLDSSEQTFTEFSSRTIGQCKESCHRALVAQYQKDGFKVYGAPSSHLASSAVDAMFNFRSKETDDENRPKEEPSYHAYKHRNDSGRGNQARSTRVRDARDNYLIDMPENLPPLIKTLVGANSLNNDSEYEKRRYIRPKRNPASPLTDDMKRIEEIQKNFEDQNVAMMAAAAAAAIWSEGKRHTISVSLRMKAYNDEWEDALRWISSWGKNMDSDPNVRSNAKVRTANQRGEEGSRYRSRDQKYSLQEHYDELFDRCTETCLGEETDHISQQAARPLHVEGFSSRFSKSLQVFPKFTMIARFLRLSRNLLAVFISSAFFWIFRDARGWWKFNRYSLSLQELLDEERNVMYKITSATKQPGKQHSSAKKKKKKWKRRDPKVVSQDGCSVPCLTSSTVENGRWPEIEEESDSDESLQQMYMMHGGPQGHASNTDSHSDQCSKGTISTSSCTTADSIQTVDSKMSKSEAKVNVTNAEDALSSKQKRDVSNQPLVPMNFPVPTAEQREEAAKRLREFQSKQLKKLIEEKRRMRETSMNTPRMSMRDVLVKNLQKDQDQVSEKVGISPPPGLMIQEIDHKHVTAVDDDQRGDDDFGFMLTDILDEDDSDDYVQHSYGTSQQPPTVKFDKDVAKSVALGDLLAPGTFRDSIHGNAYSQSSYDPWNIPINGFGNRTDSDYAENDVLMGKDDVDANIQLQVSAREFMPSWGKEGAGSPLDSKIW